MIVHCSSILDGIGKLQFVEIDPQSDVSLCEQIHILLTACASDLAEGEGGHVPDRIVRERILRFYTSRESILRCSTIVAVRFAVLNEAGRVVGTVLVSRRPGIILPEDTHGAHSAAERLKRVLDQTLGGMHSVFNFAVQHSLRYHGIARFIVESIVHIREALFNGRGLYIRSEPPDHTVWTRLEFTHFPVHDEFFESDVDLPVGVVLSLEFNRQFQCVCPKPSWWEEHWENRKHKYSAFLRFF